jgi:hypothetical protein
VAVVAKVGITGKRGKVRTPSGIFDVKPAAGGWYVVGSPPGEESGRVRYDDDRSLLEIEWPKATTSIHFRGEIEHTTFELNGHEYEIATMDFGNILVKEGNLPVVRGHGTISGVRLLEVSPEIEPFERELAFGLALRAAGIDRDLWREDRMPFPHLTGPRGP